MKGYVYLLGFENGKVKVGATIHLQSRLAFHRSTLGKMSPIVAEWASPAHHDYFSNEYKIVRFMGGVGEIASADYEAVVAFAKSLRFPVREPTTREDIRVRNKKIRSLFLRGKDTTYIATALGMTRQRVGQIIKANAPKVP